MYAVNVRSKFPLASSLLAITAFTLLPATATVCGLITYDLLVWPRSLVQKAESAQSCKSHKNTIRLGTKMKV